MFLVDECLSAELAMLARQLGYHDATHIQWIGKLGWKDWELMDVIVDGGYVFVTQNSLDFRGKSAKKGRAGFHSRVELHAGLICLNGPVGMDLDMQLELFAVALEELKGDPDLYNKALEITYDPDTDEFVVERYSIPQDGPYSR